MIPELTSRVAPLPRLGLCAGCGEEVKVRSNDTLFKHDYCPESGQPVAKLLEPTFARWLWMQSKRGDGRTNRVTRLAQWQFLGCTRSPRRTARDVEWVTAEELHGHLHLAQLARTGSFDMQPTTGEEHDFMCEYVELASKVYQRLLSERATEPQEES